MLHVSEALPGLKMGRRWGMGSRPAGLALLRGNSTAMVGNRYRAPARCARIMAASSSSLGTHRVASLW